MAVNKIPQHYQRYLFAKDIATYGIEANPRPHNSRHVGPESCSKSPSLFYSKFLSKSLHYVQLYSFYAVSSITIPYLQFKLPIKISYLSYLTLVEPLKKYSFHFHYCFFTFFLTFYIFYLL